MSTPGEKAPSNRRARYTSQACVDCQQRKVKCSGEDICLRCRARDVTCVYIPKAESNGLKRKRARSQQAIKLVHDRDGRNRHPPESNNKGDKDTGEGISLQTRVHLLEQELAQLRDSGKRIIGQRYLPTPTKVGSMERSLRVSEHLYSETAQSKVDEGKLEEEHSHSETAQSKVDEDKLEEDTDTFEINLLGANSLSISSQLRALRELLLIPPKYLAASPVPEDAVVIKLPTPDQTRHLLEVYFHEFDSWFPMLDRRDTEGRVLEALEAMGYREHCHTIRVDCARHTIRVDCARHSLTAMFCGMLAMAESLDNNSGQSASSLRLRWSMYRQGSSLIQHIQHSKCSNLDTIRYHVLTASYLMQNECLMGASQALLTAVNLATLTKLNDESTWADHSAGGQLARRKVWWTMYFLDRRLGQKTGRAYFIRESEVAVSEFSSLQTILPRPSTSPRHEEEVNQVRPLGEYFQALINLGKIWGQIWDIFFAATASCRGDWQDVEITDVKILLIRRQLPEFLTWNTTTLADYIASGEEEPSIRRRLTIFIRINLLRMIIRQNPLTTQKTLESARFCAFLASDTIEAIAAFVENSSNLNCFGYFMTASIVECIYHLVQMLQNSCLATDRVAALSSFQAAYQLLEGLATTADSAKRALKTLNESVLLGDAALSLFSTASPPIDEQFMNRKGDLESSIEGSKPEMGPFQVADTDANMSWADWDFRFELPDFAQQNFERFAFGDAGLSSLDAGGSI